MNSKSKPGIRCDYDVFEQLETGIFLLTFSLRRLTDFKFCFSLHVVVKNRTRLKLIPWRFACADNRLDATECISQLETTDESQLDSVSLTAKRTLLPSLKAVSDGSPCPPDLQRFIKSLRNIPLDEAPGEGYHRRTHLALKRAPHSKHWVLASTRFKQNLDRCRKFCRHSSKGTAVFKFEWRRHKRILQRRLKHWDRPRKMSTESFHRKVYSPFEAIQDDFGCLAKLVGDKSAKPPPAGESVKMQSEYLQSVLRQDSFFSVDLPAAADDVDAGVGADATTRQYFQCLNLHAPNSKPKSVPTIMTRTGFKPEADMVAIRTCPPPKNRKSSETLCV